MISSLSQTRIKKMMQADNNVGRIATQVPHVVNRSLELFMSELISKSTVMAEEGGQNILHACHLCVNHHVGAAASGTSVCTFDWLHALSDSLCAASNASMPNRCTISCVT